MPTKPTRHSPPGQGTIRSDARGLYRYNDAKRKFLPDLLIPFTSGKTLLLEFKGPDSSQDPAKRAGLTQWL